MSKKTLAEEDRSFLWDGLYRAIVDTMTEGAVVLAHSGDIIYSNDCFASLVGCRAADLTGKNFSSCVAPSDLLQLSSLLSYAAERPGRAELNLLREKREIVPASLSAAPLKTPEVRGLYVIVSDISLRRRVEENLIKAHIELEELLKEKHTEALRATAQLRKETYERKRLEDRLFQNEERFKLLLENSSDMTMILQKRSVAYIGPSVRSILEYDPEDVTGKNVLMLVHKDDWQKAVDSLDEGERVPGSSFCFEVRMRTKSGASRSMEFLCRNLLHDQKIGGIVVTIRDIPASKNDGEDDLRRKAAMSG